MNIAAVIVTYNRKELLAKTLLYFDELTTPPNSIIIIDNNSNDGTDETVNAWKAKTSYNDIHHIQLDKNGGGSGGFYAGLEYALHLNPDWIWLSDDDAFPEKNCFSIIRDKIAKIDEKEYSAICCSVINEGKIDKAHRRRILRHKLIFKKERSVPLKDYEKKEFQCDLFSYVGTVINVQKLKTVGLTEKDYFIWNDDTEHAWRLSKSGKIVCLTEAKIHHNAPTFTNKLTWKVFYGERNKLFMYKKHAYLTYLFLLKQLKKRIKNSINQQKKELLTAVLSAVMTDKKGIDDVYKPGWKAKK